MADTPMRQNHMWLDPIPDALRDAAMDALNQGDYVGFLLKASNEHSLNLLRFNVKEFEERGIYEAALLHAFGATRTNNHYLSRVEISSLFALADRSKLRASGDKLPAGSVFTLYRGVAGRGPARRVRGVSWTSSFERAKWFSIRHPGLADPAVYVVEVNESDVLACLNDRQEAEFIVDLPASAKPKRIAITSAPAPG